MPQNATQHNRLVADAVVLIQHAWRTYDENRGSGSMSCAIYDTAWVSMVAKSIDGQKQWLFTESFQYLLDTQSPDGGWVGNTTEPQIDGILNTAASLLSLLRHRSEPLNTSRHALEGIETRIQRAEASLASQLRNWDVAATVHVGFEMIMPALLKLLRLENPSMVLEFEAERLLEQIYTVKMSRFKLQYLYGDQPMTLLHSLEAFTSMVDFDKLAHHKVGGSMMASPSSTAAYLMHSTSWDDEAESYLRHVVRASVGNGSGAVPSAYPSMYFEYSWILSTMLRSGFSAAELSCPELDAMVELLERAFEQGNRVVGFAPGLPADVDDTAKSIICMNKMQRQPSPAAMIDVFEVATHFCTYNGERNPSFTANCNVLSALLGQPAPSHYSTQILKLTEFLCATWWDSDENIKDKWNTSWLYPSLLVVQAFVDLLDQVERGNLEPLSEDLRSRVHITLFQACFRALLRQSDHRSSEVAAYHILILCEARRLPLFDLMDSILEDKINTLVTLLSSYPDSEDEPGANRIWIEKVSFGSRLLTQSYKLAALKAASQPISVSKVMFNDLTSSRSESGKSFVKVLKQTPLFASYPEWQIQASMTEASLFQPLLRRRRLDVFPRKDMASDKYFDMIPLTLTSCNNRNQAFASTNFLYEMMVICLLTYQTDEFMEAVAGPAFQGNTSALRHIIDDVFDKVAQVKPSEGNNSLSANGTKSASESAVNGVNGMHNAVANAPTNGATSEATNRSRRDNLPITIDSTIEHEQVHKTLDRFVAYMASHPSVQSASAWDRQATLRELQIYLHAHVTQSEDNERLAQAKSRKRRRNESESDDHTTNVHRPPPPAPKGSFKAGYFRWVRTTSSDHTGCAYAYAFVGCLLSGSMKQPLNLSGKFTNKDKRADGSNRATARGAAAEESFLTGCTKYLTAAACRHLSYRTCVVHNERLYKYNLC